MYCTWESIDTDGPRTTDDDDGHTLNLYYYMIGYDTIILHRQIYVFIIESNLS